jgi:hypothetical protein
MTFDTIRVSNIPPLETEIGGSHRLINLPEITLSTVEESGLGQGPWTSTLVLYTISQS